MLTECFRPLCDGSPSLIAVYESPDGNLALLLRHTVVPLHEERGQWLKETKAAADEVVASLREAGFRGRIVVLQWRPLPEIGRILWAWSCRYDSDPTRRAELTRVVARYLADSKFIESRHHRAHALTAMRSLGLLV